MKDTFYFPHDCNARNDERMLAVRLRHGMEGYGVYFAIIEKMRENANYECLKDYNLIAFELRVSTQVVKSVVEDFGLFTFTDDGKRFYSESLFRRMEQWNEKRETLSESRRKAALSSWESRRTKNSDANAMQVQCKPDASAMQSEAKEKKEEKKKKEREKEAAGAAALQNLNAEKTEKKGTLSGKVITGTGKPLDEREKAFYNAIAAFKSDYSPEILRAFYDYWRKPTASGTRMQFETIHPSFDIGFRLARWKEHESEFRQKADGTDTNRLYSYQEVGTLVTSGKVRSTDEFERVERDGQSWWKRKVKGVA